MAACSFNLTRQWCTILSGREARTKHIVLYLRFHRTFVP